MGRRPGYWCTQSFERCVNRDRSEGVRAYSNLIVTQRNVGSTLSWAQRQTPRRTSCLLARTTRCANNMIGERAHLGNRVIDRDCGAWKRADFFCRSTLCLVSCLAGNAMDAKEFSLAARIRDQNIVLCHKKKIEKPTKCIAMHHVYQCCRNPHALRKIHVSYAVFLCRIAINSPSPRNPLASWLA